MGLAHTKARIHAYRSLWTFFRSSRSTPTIFALNLRKKGWNERWNETWRVVPVVPPLGQIGKMEHNGILVCGRLYAEGDRTGTAGLLYSCRHSISWRLGWRVSSRKEDPMAVHPCPRCGILIPVGLPYCDRCRPAAEAAALESAERKAAHRRKAYDRTYNKTRDPKYLTFYRSKDWRILSRFILQRAGYKCQAGLEGCSRLAVEVHHRVPIKTDEGWEARFDPDGLMAVCVSCHNILDNKRFQRRQKAAGVIDQRAVEAQLREGTPPAEPTPSGAPEPTPEGYPENYGRLGRKRPQMGESVAKSPF